MQLYTNLANSVSEGSAFNPLPSDIRAFYEQAQALLKHPLLELTGGVVVSVAFGFADAIGEFKYRCDACSILRDHVHLIIRVVSSIRVASGAPSKPEALGHLEYFLMYKHQDAPPLEVGCDA